MDNEKFIWKSRVKSEIISWKFWNAERNLLAPIHDHFSPLLYIKIQFTIRLVKKELSVLN